MTVCYIHMGGHDAACAITILHESCGTVMSDVCECHMCIFTR